MQRAAGILVSVHPGNILQVVIAGAIVNQYIRCGIRAHILRAVGHTPPPEHEPLQQPQACVSALVATHHTSTSRCSSHRRVCQHLWLTTTRARAAAAATGVCVSTCGWPPPEHELLQQPQACVSALVAYHHLSTSRCSSHRRVCQHLWLTTTRARADAAATGVCVSTYGWPTMQINCKYL